MAGAGESARIESTNLVRVALEPKMMGRCRKDALRHWFADGIVTCWQSRRPECRTAGNRIGAQAVKLAIFYEKIAAKTNDIASLEEFQLAAYKRCRRRGVWRKCLAFHQRQRALLDLRGGAVAGTGIAIRTW